MMSSKQNKKHRKEMAVMTKRNLELHIDIEEMMKVLVIQRDIIDKMKKREAGFEQR